MNSYCRSYQFCPSCKLQVASCNSFVLQLYCQHERVGHAYKAIRRFCTKGLRVGNFCPTLSCWQKMSNTSCKLHELATCNLQLATWTKLVLSTGRFVGIYPAIEKKMTSEEDRIVLLHLFLRLFDVIPSTSLLVTTGFL